MTEDWSKHSRKVDLNIREQVEAALGQPEQIEALHTLVSQLFNAGHTNQKIYDAFFNEHLRLRMENREIEEELIADFVLDGLSGWGSKSARLLPNDAGTK